MQVCEKIFEDSLNFWTIRDFYSRKIWEFSKKSKILLKNNLTKCQFFSDKWEGYFHWQNIVSKTFILDRQVPPKFSLISEGVLTMWLKYCEKFSKFTLTFGCFWTFFVGVSKIFKNCKKVFESRVMKCRFFSYRLEVFLIDKNYLKKFC